MKVYKNNLISAKKSLTQLVLKNFNYHIIGFKVYVAVASPTANNLLSKNFYFRNNPVCITLHYYI